LNEPEQDQNQEEKYSIQLPFSEQKQDAVLGHLLLDATLFKQARHRIQPGWFVDPAAGKVWLAKLKFYEEYKLIPTVQELREQGDFVTEEPATREKMRRKVAVAVLAAGNFQKPPLARELEGWLRAVMFRECTTKAAKLFNQKNFEECYSYLDKRIDDIKAARFVEDKEFKFDDITSEAEREFEDRQNAVSFGLSTMDRLLLPDENPKIGSLLPGDTTILLAPTNVGKTTTMLTIAKHNLLRSKSILLLTHEGRANDISMKLLCSLLDCTRDKFFELIKTKEGSARVEIALNYLKRFLVYVPYTKAGMAVEDVEPIIRQKQEERGTKYGKGFDLLIDDYPAKLTTNQAAGGHMARRHIDEVVYNYFIAMAGEYKFHSLLAIQTNRHGSKVNRGQMEDGRLLSMEDVMESWGPMTGATNVISINRDDEAMAKKLVTFYVCKSRSSDTGYAVVCKSNYAHSITHSDKLGAVWYRGEQSRIDQIDDEYLNQYLNGALPNVA
jgi:replicative DNA helicase